jgi:hypothetical protein
MWLIVVTGENGSDIRQQHSDYRKYPDVTK